MGRGVIARLAIVIVALAAAGCSVAAGIFRAGFWVGIVLAVVLVGGILMLMRGRR
jgi:hypothetical protein